MKTIVVFALLAAFAYAQNFTYFIHPLTMNKVGEVVFTPAQLPCAYTINVTAEITQRESGQSYTVIAVESMHRAKDLFMLDYSFKETPDHIAYSYRFDLEQSGMVPEFEAYAGYYCNRDDMSEEQARDAVDQFVAFFIQKQLYDTVEDTTFQGKQCKVYSTVVDDEHENIYVDENNYIIGEYLYTDDKSMEALATVKYNFDVPMSTFALDRSVFTGCDQKAYSVPPEQC